MTDDLSRAVSEVLRNDNCTGCGGCAVLARRISMQLDQAGFERPVVAPTEADDRGLVARFRAVCPGVGQVAASPAGATQHRVFGPSFGVWRAWAVDPEVRHAGSSGGVLTALTTWLLSTGQVNEVAGASAGDRSRTVPVRITTRAEALAAAGSRYAPVPTLSGYRPGDGTAALVSKPCEATAARRLEDDHGTAEADRPLRLSFFCAGTPSQWATDRLAADLGHQADEIDSVRYRGLGWPGRFTVTANDGRTSSTTYESSWGEVLGRSLQPRCKICVDGTGADADVSVGDLWATTVDGYPSFGERPGESVLIARTTRGRDLVLAAERAGAIELEAATWDAVAQSQPLQVSRRLTLAGRLIGRRLALRAVPRYRGYRLNGLALRRPVLTARSSFGSWLRGVRR